MTSDSQGTHHNQAVWSLAYAEPNRILSGSLDATVKVWTLTTGDELQLEHSFDSCHSLGITSVALDTSGKVGFSASLDNLIIIYDLAQYKVMHKIPVAAGTGFKGSLSPDGTQLAVGGHLGKVMIYNTSTGELIDSIDTLSNQFIMSLIFSPCGSFLACGTNLGLMFTLELKTMSVYRKFTVHHKPIRALAFSPTGTKLAVGGDDGRITVYDPIHQSVLGSLIGHSSWITTLRIVSEDLGDLMISGSCDTTIRFWDLSSMINLSTLKSANDSSLPYQIWELAHFKQTGKLSKIIAGLELGQLKLLDQPLFKSK